VSSTLELSTQRKNTTAFIAADPVSLVLTPHDKETTAAGGYKLVPQEPREAQMFRLIPASDRMPEISNSNGRMANPSYILLGAWDCAMERWDSFDLHGVTYEIASPVRPEHTDSPYERKGDVVIKNG
jgi:hypothetical protein